jgi:hypothetical protein
LAILHGNEGSASDRHPTENRGTFLGAGGQYTAYDAGEGRVLKWPNSLEEATRILSSMSEMDPQEHAYMVVHFRDESVPHVLRLATRYPELSSAMGHPMPLPESTFTQNDIRQTSSLLGHPRTRSDTGYSQDWVRPLASVFENTSPEETARILEDYANLQLLCWRYGVYDRLYNFAYNNGLDAQGRIVLNDFGEMSFDTTFVAAHVERQNWRDKYDVQHHLPEALHDTYHGIMESRLTKANFERWWSSSLDTLDAEVIRRPPLSERKEDIPDLVVGLLERASCEAEKIVNAVSSEVLDLFCQYHWPAGAYELQNALYRAVAVCGTDVIQLTDIPPYIPAKIAES